MFGEIYFRGNKLLAPVRSFIKQVDGVFGLADEWQKPVLLLYVKSRISEKARVQIDIHCNLTAWEEISELFLNLYQDKKSMDQLLEELNHISQGRNETVSQFYERFEEYSSRILAAIHASEMDEEILKDRIAVTNDLKRNRCIYHTHAPIFQTLRYRDFENMNIALTAALTEEKALRNRSNFQNRQSCNICNRKNHSRQDC